MGKRIRFWYNKDRNTFTVKLYEKDSYSADRHEEYTPERFANFCECVQMLGCNSEIKLADNSLCEL